jgi:hypothetical protein
MTIISDALEHEELPRPHGKSYCELLEHQFEPEASFWVKDGMPYVVWGDWDYAEAWGGAQMQSVHPFGPIRGGKEISEPEFRQLVRDIHGIR